jgi:hypothetical protein
MQYFDRYVWWLRLLLPREQRDDIIRELTEEYRSQIGEREAALGRPLTGAEHADIIAGFGHPLRMAARYRQPQHLIGPLLFPFYWPVLAVVIGIVVIVRAIAATALVAAGASIASIGGELQHLFRSELAVFTWVTIWFAVFDRALAGSAALDSWRPDRSNPGSAAVAGVGPGIDYVLQRTGRDIARSVESVAAVTGARVRSRSGPPTLAGFVCTVIFSAWWLLALRVPWLMFVGGAAQSLAWGPDIARIYPVLVVAQLAMLGRQTVRLVSRSPRPVLQALRGVSVVTTGIIIYFLFTLDHQWVIWRDGAAAAAGSAQLVALVNVVFTLAFATGAVINVLGAVKRVMQRPREPRIVPGT